MFFQKKTNHLLLLYTSLAEMLESGFTVGEALTQELSEKSPIFAGNTNKILSMINSGASLFVIMKSLPEKFPPFHQKMVKVGENSGKLPQSFRELSRILTQKKEIQEKLVGGLAYPVFILHFALLLSNAPLIVQGTGIYFWATLKLFIICYIPIVLFFGFIKIGRSIPSVRKKIDRFLLAIPFLGPILKRQAWIRFFQAFSAMYSAGISIVQCLEESSGVVNNSFFLDEIKKKEQLRKEGASISEIFKDFKTLPPLALKMIYTGEQSGKLDETFATILTNFQNKNQLAISRLLAIIPTLVLVGVGSLIGWKVISFYKNLYSGLL